MPFWRRRKARPEGVDVSPSIQDASEPMGNTYMESFLLTTQNRVIFAYCANSTLFGTKEKKLRNIELSSLPDNLRKFIPEAVKSTFDGNYLQMSLTFDNQLYVCKCYPIFGSAPGGEIVYSLTRIYIPIPTSTRDLIASIDNDGGFGRHAEKQMEEIKTEFFNSRI